MTKNLTSQVISGLSTIPITASIIASIDLRHHHLGIEQAVDVLEC
jgi:hypothetical protein